MTGFNSARVVVVGSVAFAALTVGSSAGCVRLAADYGDFADRQERRFTVTGVPEVNLSTTDGSVVIRRWDRSDVSVVIERVADTEGGLREIVVSANQDGNRITVDASAAPHGSVVSPIHWHRRRYARLIVSLPSSSNLSVRTDDGSISLSGVSGRLNLRTDDGSIRGDDLSGDVVARSGDGSISLRDLDGVVDAQTADGSIIANGRLTGVKVLTNDGSISVRAENGSKAAADWSLSSGDGSVKLSLPAGFNAELDALTRDGHIRVRSEGNARGEAKPSLQMRLGEGGPTLRLRTDDGSITVQ